MFPLVSDVAMHLNCSKTVTNIMCGCFKLHYDDDKMTKLVECQFITLINITRFQQFKKLHSSAISVRNSSSMLIPTKYKKNLFRFYLLFSVFSSAALLVAMFSLNPRLLASGHRLRRQPLVVVELGAWHDGHDLHVSYYDWSVWIWVLIERKTISVNKQSWMNLIFSSFS